MRYLALSAMLFLFAFGAVSQETAQVLPSDGTTVAMQT